MRLGSFKIIINVVPRYRRRMCPHVIRLQGCWLWVSGL